MRIRQRLLPVALEVLQRHRDAGDRVLIATGAPPELARAILDFVAHEDLPVIGSLMKPFLGGLVTEQHCHAQNKMRMIWDAGYDQIAIAYSDSSADLPLLQSAAQAGGGRIRSLRASRCSGGCCRRGRRSSTGAARIARGDPVA